MIFVVLLAAWGSSLYGAQHWGATRGESTGEVVTNPVLCEDALDRRFQIEKALYRDLQGIGYPIPIREAPGYLTEVARLERQQRIVEQDIRTFCLGELATNPANTGTNSSTAVENTQAPESATSSAPSTSGRLRQLIEGGNREAPEPAAQTSLSNAERWRQLAGGGNREAPEPAAQTSLSNAELWRQLAGGGNR